MRNSPKTLEQSAAQDWQGYRSHLQTGGEPLVSQGNGVSNKQFRVSALVASVAVGAVVGAWAMTHQGATVGNFVNAWLAQRTDAFLLNLFADNAGFAMACGAILGGIASAALYGLAVSSPAYHKPRSRRFEMSRHVN